MKKVPSIVILSLIMFFLATGVTYGIGFALKLPLPLVEDGVHDGDYSKQDALMERWKNVRIYEMTAAETVKEIVEAAPVPEDTSDQKFLKKFDEIESVTLKTYLDNNKDLVATGYDKLLIDKVDANNTPTGIKTTAGDDVLAIDTYDNMIIAGLTVNGQKGKLVILKNTKQLGLSVVENLRYWETIGSHATRENSILAINASGYTWNNTGNYGTLYGLAIRNGDLIRKAKLPEQSVGFNKEGKMIIGGAVETLYNACEYYPALIKESVDVYTGQDATKAARTAIGQTADGDVLMVVVDGDINTSGATLGDLLGIMKKYGAVNAANLSEGHLPVIWWNGKVVSKPYGEAEGVRLPTAWVIKSASEIVE